MVRVVRQLCLLGFLTLGFAPSPAHASEQERPRLVLFIVVDQLRGDMPWRFQDRFGQGGFRLLMEQGVAYKQAHFQHSSTFTSSGHATLVTGGHAAQHGFPGNDWHDRNSGRQVYCVEDEAHSEIGRAAEEHAGTSPRNLTSSTFGDELYVATDGRSRVFSVSMKDRSAIIMGGRFGKAYWYRDDAGSFVTSTYYYSDYPAWVARWNEADHVGQYADKHWELLRNPSEYIYAERDDRPFEVSHKHLGRTFPHKLGADNPADFYSALRYSPMGDEYTLEFAKELVVQEQLGAGDHTDVLSIGLSATDYIGHAFGPNSLEAEDNLLRLNQNLSRFFTFVDNQVGLENTLVVLSADHGVDASPEHTYGLGGPAGRHYPDLFIRALNDRLKERLSTERDLITAFWNPSLYLDLAALKELGFGVEQVERVLAEEVLTLDGFAYAVTRTDLLKSRTYEDPILRKVQRGFHPRRSGNVVVVQSPSWYLYPQADAYSAMHGSPYAYDTYVPVFFAGAGLSGQLVDRQIAPHDVAATVASLLGIQPPSGSTGTPLTEVLEGVR